MDALEFLTNKLNPAQKEAVLTSAGPLLILAGAGSGKTRVLTHRMAHLIGTGQAAPEEILCVTFTNKAAREMESRIYHLLSEIGAPVRSHLWISTFHSFCVRILKRHITLLDYKPGFSIFDPGDQLSQIKKVMAALNINDKIHPAKNFQHRISNAKMLGMSPEKVQHHTGLSVMDPKSLEVYARYEIEMKKNNALDFDDLLMKTYDLLEMYPAVLEELQNHFRYIMVDEYQDTNHIQYLLVQKLAEKHRNLCVVGDEDQSIYSWRGADIRNILDFEKDFPEAKVVKLEENYRSSNNIVTAATYLIKNNSQRKDKTLFTENPDGDPIHVIEERTEYDEARFVVKTIQGLMNQGEGNYSDYAIFYRTNAQSRVLEEQLRTHNVPYKIVGGVRFFERMEIKDVISYMKLILNPADDMALKRIINVPARGIGKTTVEQLEEWAMQNKRTLFEAIPLVIDNKIFNSGTTGKLRRFFDLMTQLRSDAKDFPKLSDFYPVLLDKTGYVEVLKKEDSTEAAARLENLEEFDNAIAQFEQERGEEATLQTFLEEMALVSDQDSLKEQINSVTLMTLHISKGLEYPYVFMVGMEENLFPSRIDPTNLNPDDLEEERRLAYVGMTRARQKLWMTYAKMRKVWGQEQMNPPSRFIKEIPQKLVEFKSFAPRMPSFASRSPGAYGTPAGYGSKPKYRDDFDQSFPEYDEESSSGGNSDYNKGQRVKHPTFGVGTVFSVEGAGDLTKVSVLFSDQTIKKFVVKYARLEKI